MKKIISGFVLRGLICASFGPLVYAIVLKIIDACGMEVGLTADKVLLGVITSLLLAFVAAGLTVVYTVERLPLLFAVLIHSAFLFTAYLTIYLVNGWITPDKIVWFALIFIAVFAVTWLITWLSVRSDTKKLNKKL